MHLDRHPPKTLPTSYHSACLPSIFINNFTNKVLKLRANIASEHVASALVTGTTAATLSSFEKVSQFTVKECILNSAPNSCELDPTPSKLLVECLDSIISLIYFTIFLHLLASSHNASNQLLLLLSTPLHQRAASRVQHPKSCGSQQSLPPGGKERLHFVGIRPEVQARKGGW